MIPSPRRFGDGYSAAADPIANKDQLGPICDTIGKRSVRHPAFGVVVHLGELNRGQRAVVTGVANSEAFCQLCSLGLNSGAEVQVVRSLSGRSLLVVRVDGFDIALRLETATTVKVRLEPGR